MSVKTNGAEYKAYIAETDLKWWPEGSYMDDTLLIVNGEEIGDDNYTFDPNNLEDEDVVVIDCGSYYRDANDLEPTNLTTHFKNWRKAQATVRFAVEVHKDKFDELKALIKSNGGKVA